MSDTLPGGPSAGDVAGIQGTDFHAAIRKNESRTVWLCLLMVMIGGLLGYVIGWACEIFYLSRQGAAPGEAAISVGEALAYFSPWGQVGAVAMVVASVAWLMVALCLGDRILLGMTGAREVSVEEAPVLHNVVEEMALASGLPKPRVLLLESPALNAFATGLKPEKSAIAVTRGLLERLERPELQGVVAHEMGHIANNDVLYATAVGVTVGLIALVCDVAFWVVRPSRSYRYGYRSRSWSRSGNQTAAGIVALIVLAIFVIAAPLAARLVQMAISREREYLADATAVKFTRNPLGLIGALEKIEGTEERFDGANRAIQHLFIANPFRKAEADDSSLFATHPAMGQRIDRLRNLG